MVVLICISLIISEVEQLFMCFLCALSFLSQMFPSQICSHIGLMPLNVSKVT